LLRWNTGSRTLTLFAGTIEDGKSYDLAKTEAAKIVAAVRAGNNPAQASSAAAAGQAYQASRRDPATFDIAGVRLGMTQQQATTALAAAGFGPSSVFPPSLDLSYEQAVDVRAKQLSGVKGYYPSAMQGVGRLVFEHPGGAMVTIAFVNPPEGARVDSVSYEIPAKRIERQAFIDRVTSKYGPPTLANASSSLWCSKAYPGCPGSHAGADNGPTLSAGKYPDNSGNLMAGLMNSPTYGWQLRQAVEAEAKRRVGQ